MKQLDLRIIANLLPAVGARANCMIDSAESPNIPYNLSNWTVSFDDVILLPPSAADQLFTFTAPSFLLLWSNDGPFQHRLGVTETLRGPSRLYIEAGDDTAAVPGSVLTTGLLLTNPSSTSQIEIRAIGIES